MNAPLHEITIPVSNAMSAISIELALLDAARTKIATAYVLRGTKHHASELARVADLRTAYLAAKKAGNTLIWAGCF
ncbi:hypothetical protein [Agarivorans sp. QJM3NY_25]|uniref:hypothetical protein n=1 Tax=Agarivorans sp. QJM3NY_25 TaxID=3421430 RepID=UPI003D7E3940